VNYSKNSEMSRMTLGLNQSLQHLDKFTTFS
jgi:hypothetical protein